MPEKRTCTPYSEHLQSNACNALRCAECHSDKTKKESEKRAKNSCSHETKHVIPLRNMHTTAREERDEHADKGTHRHHSLASEVEYTSSLIEHLTGGSKKKSY